MAAELRTRKPDDALSAVQSSLSTIAEREAAGYITERMVQHRLRLLDLERELTPSAPRIDLVSLDRSSWNELRTVRDERLRASMQLIVHGRTTEWVDNREKPLSACFVLRMQIENLADERRTLGKPEILAAVPFPVSRWYLFGGDGAEWDGVLEPLAVRSAHAIGYLGDAVRPGTRVHAEVRFEGLTLRAETLARARWNQSEVEPTSARL
jgi:hypothetical protein